MAGSFIIHALPACRVTRTWLEFLGAETDTRQAAEPQNEGEF